MAQASRRPGPGPKSSLLSHSFPPFYACYLLKSIQTPLSKATYIGSTPNPPRRIRQHNGEIAAGAWKTKHKRPWVMHMIVHGFPSRLAALQFEWAWQHPHLSRHLRDDSGKAVFASDRKSKYLKMNIQIVRTMISNHPYITWPLHVKLFTEEAVSGWEDAAKPVGALPLPPGFTCSIELEGVDGKSGKLGSGRKGPINVKDENFTSSYLAKNTALLASGSQLSCTVCHEPIVNYTTETLSTALCPTPTCAAVSHLSCLAHRFSTEQPADTGLVPRGGTCTSCKTYTLWGDIVRGSYRRSAGGVVPEEEEIPDDAQGAASGSDEDRHAILSPTSSPHKPSKRKAKQTLPATKKHFRRKDAATHPLSSEGEIFDLYVSSTDEDGAVGLRTTKKQVKSRRVVSPELHAGLSDEGGSSGPPKKRGRPRKLPIPNTSASKAGPSINKEPIRKIQVSNRTPAKRKVQNRLQGSDESGEFFDFGTLSGATTSDDDAPTRRKGKAKLDTPAPLGISSPKRGLTPRVRLKSNSPQGKRAASTQAYMLSLQNTHDQESTLKSPSRPFPQLEPLGMLTSPYNTDTDSDEILPPVEDVLMRAMSSLSVSSPAPSPERRGQRYDAMDIIEISD